jgi:thiol-disulfide isomerase/thioredoxin
MVSSSTLKWRRFNLFRKLPEDMQTQHISGSIVSLLSVLVVISLVLYECQAFTKSELHTEIIMDGHQEDLLTVHFNLSFPSLPCRYANVDLSDHMGQRFVNISHHIRRWRLETRSDVSLRLEELFAPPEENFIIHEVHEGEKLSELLSTPEEFDEFIRKYDLVLVQYFAPWCRFCTQLAPVWEFVAGQLLEEPEFNERVKLARVDCTDPRAQQTLCQRAHIRAFPSLLIYANGDLSSRYMYAGPRSPVALMLFLKMFFHQLHPLSDQQLSEQQREMFGRLFGREVGIPPAHLAAEDVHEGCLLAGSVSVNRVPGKLSIVARSASHSFDEPNLDMSHIVHALCFGTIDDVIKCGNNVTRHVAIGQNVTIEHYLKVVGVDSPSIEMGGGRLPHRTYRYSFSSNQYEAQREAPMAVFTYDVSPLVIRETVVRVPLYQFITSLCAIIGGIVTLLGGLQTWIYLTMTSFERKRRLGKAH